VTFVSADPATTPTVGGPVWTIVVAAGSGDRFGGPKQFLRVAGTRLVDRAVGLAKGCSDGVVIVVPPGHAWTGAPVDAVVEGGATRAESTRNGLTEVPADVAIIVVHDAARPLADTGIFASVVAAVRSGLADGAVPGIPVADTLKRVDASGTVVGTVERDRLYAVQTPQAFRAAVLRAAHISGEDATDDAGLVEAVGGTVVVVTGSARNVKITVADDVEIATALLAQE
jgi:2-C-methyl-D-erythritol 4-phosphate cytidylyltransferase